jgi:predicted TIM-barrel fold metal-dependent hydrolase
MFRRSIYACFWFEEAGPLRLLDDVGVDNVLWETDFPHPTCLYPNPVERTLDLMRDVDPVVIRKVMHDNAARLYGIAVPAELGG